MNLNRKNIMFAIAASCGGIISGVISLATGLMSSTKPLIGWVVTGGLDAALIGLSLMCMQSYYQNHKLILPKDWQKGIKIGLLIGSCGGLISFLLMTFFIGGNIGRVLGWALSGGVVGYVAALRIPNLSKKIAVIAGATGGGIGCLVMYMGLGYTTGVAITGAAIGIMVATAEKVFRKIWIDVTVHPTNSGGISLTKKRNFTLTLGARPIIIGFSPEADIILEKESGISHVSARIVLQNDNVILHDIDKIKEEILTEGNIFKYYHADLVVQKA